MIQHDIDTLSRQWVCNNLSIVGADPSLKQETQQQIEERNTMHKTFFLILPQTFSKDNTTTSHHNITTNQQSTTGYTCNNHNKD